MEIYVANETGRLRSVVLGQPVSMGPVPLLSDAYDAKSYQCIQAANYPTEADITNEMNAFLKILEKYDVKVYRPNIIENYNQVFARDVAFVIGNKMFISNIIQERFSEQEAYSTIFESIHWKNLVNLPDRVHIEGGDVVLWNDFLFVGTCYSEDYRNFKTARTNSYAIDLLREYFPEKRIIDLDLKKDDHDPRKGILHLDCTLNMVGKDKCIVYPNGFVKDSDFHLILDIFGEENCFIVSTEEVVDMFPNIFSIDPQTVVSDGAFTRLNKHLREVWGMTVEELPYREISKMGGLLRCSTMPLVRDK